MIKCFSSSHVKNRESERITNQIVLREKKKERNKNEGRSFIVVDDQCCIVKESNRSYSLFALIKASASVHAHICIWIDL